jgi:hypothetical protein
MLEAEMGFCVVVEIDEAVGEAMGWWLVLVLTTYSYYVLELPLSISATQAPR